MTPALPAHRQGSSVSVVASPYVKSPERLADVIAAIQVMGVYKYYKLDFAGWADRIVGDKGQAEHWKQVFIAHPEFFRLDGRREKASLVWRRQNRKTYHVDLDRDLTSAELDALAPDDEARISRRPLTPDDVSSLVSTAIEMHARALEGYRESRRWIDVLVGIGTALAGLIGALLGGYLSSL